MNAVDPTWDELEPGDLLMCKRGKEDWLLCVRRTKYSFVYLRDGVIVVCCEEDAIEMQDAKHVSGGGWKLVSRTRRGW